MSLPVIGTILNVAGILIGGTVGLTRRQPLSPHQESALKVVIAVFTVWFGLLLVWRSLGHSFGGAIQGLLLTMVALGLGKLTGHFLRLQRFSNRLGRNARDLVSVAPPRDQRLANGLKTGTILFCAAPLGLLGAFQDGCSDYRYPLAIKAVIDGLATLGFVKLFGPGVMLAALPVLAFQGSLSLLSRFWVGPWLASHGLLDATNAVGGFLVFSVSLVILGLRRIELADYLPALAWAPLLTWLLNWAFAQ